MAKTFSAIFGKVFSFTSTHPFRYIKSYTTFDSNRITFDGSDLYFL